MGQKWPFFNLFFKAIQARPMSFTIFQNEKRRYKNKKFKSRKIDIFAKGLNHCFEPKMSIFPTLLFQAIQAGKMSFRIFQNEKTPFQAIKTRSSKSRKIHIVLKGLTQGFGAKMAISPTFFYAIQARKMCFKKFQNEKAPLYAIKTKSSKIRKIDIFSKGLTRGMGQKWPFFQLFFRQYRPTKCLLRYSRTKKGFSTL